MLWVSCDECAFCGSGSVDRLGGFGATICVQSCYGASISNGTLNCDENFMMNEKFLPLFVEIC